MHRALKTIAHAPETQKTCPSQDKHETTKDWLCRRLRHPGRKHNCGRFLQRCSPRGADREISENITMGRVAVVAQRPIVVKLSCGRSVGLCVGLSVRRSVCPVHCGNTTDRIRMPFGITGRTRPGFGHRSTERGTFGGEFEAPH